MTEAWKQWEGQVVNGEFHLRQYLGGCENSAVFLTEYGELELQNAALKLIPAPPENAELQLSLWWLAAKLSHPHLIRLFQIGRCQLGNMGLLYLVMEYAGENLSQILPQRPLAPVEAREMLEPVLDALAYLHGQGFVHGHIKPANIMAVGDQLKISTDGLCRMDESGGRSWESRCLRRTRDRRHSDLAGCGCLVAWDDACRSIDPKPSCLGQVGTRRTGSAGDAARSVP